MRTRTPKLAAAGAIAALTAIVATATVAAAARVTKSRTAGPRVTVPVLAVTAQAGRATPALTPDLIALGDSIFRGKVAGGLCFTCHQPNAKGLPGIAPDLTDDKWLHGDGSYEFIVATVTKGVPKPKQAVAPMLPKGGANLTDAQIRAVA